MLNRTGLGVSRQGAQDGLVIEGRIMIFFEFGTLSSMLIRFFTRTLERHTLCLHVHVLLLLRRSSNLRRRSIHHGSWCRSNIGVHGRLRLHGLLELVRLGLRRLLLLVLRLARAGTLSFLTTGGGFPRSSPPGAWPTSNRIQGRVDFPGILAQGAVRLGLLLGPPQALEVLAGSNIS